MVGLEELCPCWRFKGFSKNKTSRLESRFTRDTWKMLLPDLTANLKCYEGRPVLEINRVRMIRSGLVGFCLHGSLSHFYYHACEALFPFDDWWAVPVKVAFDQTAWSGLWNSIYFCMLGILRLESPVTIASELRATFLPMLTAGWKLWPFAHLITYGLIPVEQRLLWVDCVELVWVTILSMYSNEKSEARLHDGETENTSTAESSSRNAGKL
ncbi:hypothetical protein KP509_22G080900 [Ceratopteris richardii]|uniref:Peroxisomal membrane protein 2 n=1 Tax=Ceratopteris richardii TaxID=49495 RepID=A0A8T2SA34_CERRI|nr:hypothetical protein KP509_22G080900 [Ceratopteris richardii]